MLLFDHDILARMSPAVCCEAGRGRAGERAFGRMTDAARARPWDPDGAGAKTAVPIATFGTKVAPQETEGHVRPAGSGFDGTPGHAAARPSAAAASGPRPAPRRSVSIVPRSVAVRTGQLQTRRPRLLSRRECASTLSNVNSVNLSQ